jgi:hypothetical protein
MKKVLSAALAIVSAVFVGSAMADVAKDKTLSMIKVPAGTVKSVSAVDYPTDIVIANHSSHLIYVEVPSARINDTLYAGDPDMHLHGNYYDPTYVVLRDYRGTTFLQRYVANHEYIPVVDAFNKTSAKVK